MATYNSGIQIVAAASATTLSSTQMAVCTYTVSAIQDASGGVSAQNYGVTTSVPPATRVFGPNETIPSTFTSKWQLTIQSNAPAFTNTEYTVTYSLVSGVILGNT